MTFSREVYWGGEASLQGLNKTDGFGEKNIQVIKEGDVFRTINGTDKLVDIRYLKGEQITYTISKLSGKNDRFVANGLIVGVEELDND